MKYTYIKLTCLMIFISCQDNNPKAVVEKKTPSENKQIIINDNYDRYKTLGKATYEYKRKFIGRIDTDRTVLFLIKDEDSENRYYFNAILEYRNKKISLVGTLLNFYENKDTILNEPTSMRHYLSKNSTDENSFLAEGGVYEVLRLTDTLNTIKLYGRLINNQEYEGFFTDLQKKIPFLFKYKK